MNFAKFQRTHFLTERLRLLSLKGNLSGIPEGLKWIWKYLNCRTTFLDSGDIYGWGWNESGQVGVLEEEGNGLQKLCFFPTLLDTPLDITFCQISAGSRHSAGVTIDGELYTWGWNGYGQLCHCDQNTRTSPTKVEFFIGGNFKVVEVVCSQWCTVVKSEHLHEWLVLLF